MAVNSSSVGGRLVTTLASRLSRPITSVSRFMVMNPPGAERMMGSRRACIQASVFMRMMRQFFFFWRMARASASYSGAMMTSVKMALSTRARPSVIGRLTTITPPKGACVSVSKAFCHALRRSSSSWPTPQGFVCFKMPTVGRRNWVISSAAPSMSSTFV